jgi:hypothetical protein
MHECTHDDHWYSFTPPRLISSFFTTTPRLRIIQDVNIRMLRWEWHYVVVAEVRRIACLLQLIQFRVESPCKGKVDDGHMLSSKVLTPHLHQASALIEIRISAIRSLGPIWDSVS